MTDQVNNYFVAIKYLDALRDAKRWHMILFR